MTKTDAEQHSAVWELADKMLQERLAPAQADRLTELVAAILATSYLASSIAKSYSVLARSLDEKH